MEEEQKAKEISVLLQKKDRKQIYGTHYRHWHVTIHHSRFRNDPNSYCLTEQKQNQNPCGPVKRLDNKGVRPSVQ